jgi:hypothetical protein
MIFSPETLANAELIVDAAMAVNAEFGERCPDYDPECCVCQAWARYDAATRKLIPRKSGRVFRVRV